MSNTIAAGIKDDIIKQNALLGFNEALLPITAMATDLSPEPGKRGSSVSVGLIGTASAGDFAGNYTTNPDTTVTEVEVDLDKHKYKTVHLTDVEYWGSSAVRLEQFGYQAGAAVGNAVVADVLSIITLANYGASVNIGGPAGFDSDDMADLRNTCNGVPMPKIGRFAALISDYTTALNKDDSIKSVANSGSDAALRRGDLGMLSGFRILESDIIPDNSENLVGFAGVRDGIAVAMRYLAPQEGNTYRKAEPLVDAETGLVLGLRDWYDNNTGIHYMTFECLYGKSVGNSAGLKRLTSV